MKAAVRSLAEMRRLVATPGVVIRVLEHWQPQLVGLERRPVKVQHNAYSYEAPRFSDGKVGPMWCYYPKASELRFNEDGSVTFYPGMDKRWTLAFEVPE